MSDDAPLHTFRIDLAENRLYVVTYRVKAANIEEAIGLAIEGSERATEINRDFSDCSTLAIDAVWQDGTPVPFIDPLNEDEGEKIADGKLEEEA